MIRSLARQTWVHVAVGAVLMGSWAIFANRVHGMPERVMAGVVQGLLSGVLTGLLKGVADHLRARQTHWTVAAVLALLVSASLLLSVHWLVGTPELAATAAVPLAVSGCYVFLYAHSRRGDLP